MGYRAKRVRHQIQTKDNDKRVGIGIFHHGIHTGRACRSCPINARPPHLEVVCGWGRQRAGLILTSPEGIDLEYALRFGFQASNNEAEYEAVIAGLNPPPPPPPTPWKLISAQKVLF